MNHQHSHASRNPRIPAATLVLFRSTPPLMVTSRRRIRETLRSTCTELAWRLDATDVGRHHVRVVVSNAGLASKDIRDVFMARLRQIADLESSKTYPPQPLYTEQQVMEACCEVLFEDSHGPYVLPSAQLAQRGSA